MKRAPLKKMATPWWPRSRPKVTSLPGRRRLSGAVRDKQKEAPEGRSGWRRDRAAGARGCRLGGRARLAQVSGWGGEGGASCHLSKYTPVRPRLVGWPRAPWVAWALPARAGSLGASRGSSVRPTSGFPIPRVTGPPPASLWCRGARAPSQAPQCLPALYITGSFRLGSPGPLVISWVPPDPHPSTHTRPPY